MENEALKRLRKAQIAQGIRSLILKLILVILFFYLLFSYVFGITKVHGTGMAPGINDGDVVLYYRLGSYTNEETIVYKGDIVRIAASSGQTVSSNDNKELLIDDLMVMESETDMVRTKIKSKDLYPITLETGEYFVLGDNREEALDSRDYGKIKEEDIDGSVITVLKTRGI